MILVVDHFDSFVENLARYVREAGEDTRLVRSDRFTIDQARSSDVTGVILSPGPGTPRELPAAIGLFDACPDLPIFGVCLGHQILAEAYGGATVRADEPVHGRTSKIHHEGDSLFAGIASPFMAGRYHSLLASFDPDGPVRPTAWGRGGTAMAARHETRPHLGVQFHPESLLTPDGPQIIRNFLELTKARPQ